MLLLIKKWYSIVKKKCELAFYRKRIIKMYGNRNNLGAVDEEHREIVDFLRKNPARVLNYSFVDEMQKNRVEVLKDDREQLLYVLHNGKRMYFPKGWSEQKIAYYYRTISEEQHENSPHRYLTSELLGRDYDTVVDIGGAEGIFALDMIEHVKKIYIFETELYWREALERTFFPWKDKVIVISKYVSEKVGGEYTTLDYELQGEKVDLIKMDVEGAEISVLKGAKSICMANPDMRLLVCVYHYAGEYEEVTRFLNGYEIKERHGYLLYHWGGQRLKSPYLRRGVIEATYKGLGKKN